VVIDGVSLIANYRSQFTRVQGVFQSLEAAAHLAEQFRRDGATISETWLTNDAGNRVGVRARVRVGPFADRSDALSKLRDLSARGQAGFIAEARD